MNDLLRAALDLQTFLDNQGWPFCIIGGIALIRWGIPRFTRDIDIALLTGFGREDEFVTVQASKRARCRNPEECLLWAWPFVKKPGRVGVWPYPGENVRHRVSQQTFQVATWSARTSVCGVMSRN